MIFGLEFPPIENLVEWPNAFGPEDSWYGFNKIALIGFGIDKLLGTVPVFTIVFAILGLVGAVTKIYFTYRAEMEQHEANGPWNR